MAKYKKIVTTAAGLALLENAAYMGSSIQFTAFKTGSGSYDGTEDLSVATDLKNVKQTFGIGSVSRKESAVVVRVVINNNDLTEGYDITELGLYATNPDTGSEVLYAIIIAEPGHEDYIPPFTDAPTSQVMEMYMELTESEAAVTFTAVPMEGVYALAADLNDVRAEVEATKKSVSDGKALVADAITEKGIETATDATFETMAENILQIETGGGEEQLINYAMLYDEGDECARLTGGWGSTFTVSRWSSNNSTALTKVNATKSSDHVNIAVTGQKTLCPINTLQMVDFSGYSMLYVHDEVVKTAYTHALQFTTALTGNYAFNEGTMPSQSLGVIGYDVAVGKAVRPPVDISNMPSAYLSLYTLTGTSGYAQGSINLHHVFLVKNDDWQTWIEKGGLSTDDYSSLSAVMADAEALNTLMNDSKAVSFMLLNCTGHVMASAIRSSDALSAIRNSQYNAEIYSNTHWNKFLRMVGEVPESEKTYLYKDGDECTALTGGWAGYPYRKVNFGSVGATPTLSKDAEKMVIGLSGKGVMASLYSENKIDIFGYKKIKVECVISGGLYTGAWLDLTTEKKNDYTTVAVAMIHYHTVDYTPIQINVSNISDSCYVAISFETNNAANETISIEITRIWLEF